MAAIQPGERLTAPAGVDLTGKRYYYVKFDTNQNIVLATSATDILGVLDNEPKAGANAEVVLLNGVGTFKVKLAANTSAKASLTSDSNGKAVATTNAGDIVCGRLVRTGVQDEIAEYVKTNYKY